MRMMLTMTIDKVIDKVCKISPCTQFWTFIKHTLYIIYTLYIENLDTILRGKRNQTSNTSSKFKKKSKKKSTLPPKHKKRKLKTFDSVNSSSSQHSASQNRARSKSRSQNRKVSKSRTRMRGDKDSNRPETGARTRMRGGKRREQEKRQTEAPRPTHPLPFISEENLKRLKKNIQHLQTTLQYPQYQIDDEYIIEWYVYFAFI